MSSVTSPRLLRIFLGGCAFCAAACFLSARIPAVQGAPIVKVGPWDAMKAAEAKVPGSKAYNATYAQEGGKWLYDVIVIKGKTITEVEVDAATGKVGDTEAATPEGEGKELTAGLNKAIGNMSKAKAVKEEKDEKEENEAAEKPKKP